MKQVIKRILVGVLILTICVVPVTQVKATETGEASILAEWYNPNTGKYTCPYDKESEEWSTAANSIERKRLFSIPEEVLSQMTTENLLEEILKYPYLSDIMYFESYEEGLESIMLGYNGLSELVKRDDSASILLAKYIDSDVIPNFQCAVKNVFFESILSKDEVINSLTATELKYLENAVNDKFLKKEEMPYYSGMQTVFEDSLLENENVSVASSGDYEDSSEESYTIKTITFPVCR